MSSSVPTMPPAHAGGMTAAVARASGALARLPQSLVQLVLRLALAIPFWNSGLTKWSGWFELSDGVVYLFTEEFKLHVFGRAFDYPLPGVMAATSAIGEIALPVLLIVGLATRFAALGILLMTAVIQLTIPDGWANFHLPWAAMALAVMAYGPGRASLDHAIAGVVSRRAIRSRA
jgi:putative oxidoreductase